MGSHPIDIQEINWDISSLGMHSYKGLLFDAEQGVVLSQLLVYEGFCALIRRGQTPPPEILKFVGRELSLVLEKKQTPNKMFNKSGKKIPTVSPYYWQLVDLHHKPATGDITAAFESVSDALGGKPSPSQIREHYYKYQRRIERIKHVNELIEEKGQLWGLDRSEFDESHSERICEIYSELAKIYENPSQLI